MSASSFSGVQFGKRNPPQSSSFLDLDPLPPATMGPSSSKSGRSLLGSTGPASLTSRVSLFRRPPSSTTVQISYKPDSENYGVICDRATRAEQAYLMQVLQNPILFAQIYTFADMQKREITLSGPALEINIESIGRLFSAITALQRKQIKVDSFVDKLTGLTLRFASATAKEPEYVKSIKDFKTMMNKFKLLAEQNPHHTVALPKGVSKALLPRVPKGQMLHLSSESFLKLYSALKAYEQGECFLDEKIEFSLSYDLRTSCTKYARLLSDFVQQCEFYLLSIHPDVQKAVDPKLSSFTSFASDQTVYDLFRSGAFPNGFSREELSKALVPQKSIPLVTEKSVLPSSDSRRL